MSQFPLNPGPPECLAVAREFFQEVGFEAASLCRLFGIASMSAIGDVPQDPALLESVEPRLRTCIEVFLRGFPVPAETIRSRLPEPVVAAFLELGLLRPSQQKPGALICPVWLYPVAEFVVASDRRDTPDDAAVAPGTDVVFPAIYGLTSRFLELLPAARNCDALDLCGGTGIGAMLLARAAKSATTSDLAERAARFAEFNARLNNIPVESVCGDLYEGVAGRTFDVIVAHPPFVPQLGERVIFRDAGETGEDITRSLVEGLPQFLRPGGTCLVVCWARDTEEASFEKRVAEWLGAASPGFDVIFGLEKVKSVEQLVGDLRQHRQLSPEGWQKFYERLKELRTVRFVYGPIMIRRLTAPEAVPAPPARIGIATSARGADLEGLFRWRRSRMAADFAARLQRSRPRLAAGLELEIRHAVRDGELKPVAHTFSTEEPFRSGVRVEGWMVPLFAGLDGQATVAEVYTNLFRAGRLKPGFPLEAYLELIVGAVDQGFLQVELAP